MSKVKSKNTIRIELTAAAQIKLEEWMQSENPSKEFVPRFRVVDILPDGDKTITMWLGTDGE